MELSIVASRLIAYLRMSRFYYPDYYCDLTILENVKQLSIASLFCGGLMTSLEMAGISLSILPVTTELDVCALYTLLFFPLLNYF
jgi:hypothetical protein